MVRGNRLYFAASTTKGQELWVTDGTARGTRALTNFPNQAAFADVGSIFQPHEELNGRFLFWANDGTHFVEPWITDGTRQGTRLLKDICPGNVFCSGSGTVLRVFNGRLYFTAANRARGLELWSTDGRSARFVSDICPGSCDSSPYAPFVLDGFLYFVARDDQHGHEIWATRGTAAETFRATDFALRYPWEERDGFQGAVLDGKLLFAADDGVHGLELWVLEP
jgi:ELWxxDGT repeat protein